MDDIKRKFPCTKCCKRFKKPSQLQQHNDSAHWNGTYVHCPVCSIPSKNKNSLDFHVRKFHRCHRCDVQMKTVEERKTHLKIHPLPEKPRWSCQQCNKSLSTFNALKIHMNIHTGKKTFKCQLCPANFGTSGILSRHLKTHTGEKPFKCDHCPQRYVDAGDLRKHIRVHTLETPFECIFCGKQVKFSSALKSHYRTHVRERPFNCKFCSMEFAQSTHLKNHLRTHTGEKPFQCARCTRKFTTASIRNQHERAKCQVTKIISCVFCGHMFQNNYNYFGHLLWHIGEKPHSCSFCGKEYTSITGMNNHIIGAHTNEKHFRCRNCSFAAKSGASLLHHTVNRKCHMHL